MARELISEHKDANEKEYSNIFEAPELLTLGLLYERNKQFSGGVFRPTLKKVDKFLDMNLNESLKERKKYADLIQIIDSELKRITAELEQKGIKSPYLRVYVAARINPLHTFHSRKKIPENEIPSITETFEKMIINAKGFDISKVKRSDLTLTSALMSSEHE